MAASAQHTIEPEIDGPTIIRLRHRRFNSSAQPAIPAQLVRACATAHSAARGGVSSPTALAPPKNATHRSSQAPLRARRHAGRRLPRARRPPPCPRALARAVPASLGDGQDCHCLSGRVPAEQHWQCPWRQQWGWLRRSASPARGAAATAPQDTAA